MHILTEACKADFLVNLINYRTNCFRARGVLKSLFRKERVREPTYSAAVPRHSAGQRSVPVVSLTILRQGRTSRILIRIIVRSCRPLYAFVTLSPTWPWWATKILVLRSAENLYNIFPLPGSVHGACASRRTLQGILIHSCQEGCTRVRGSVRVSGGKVCSVALLLFTLGGWHWHFLSNNTCV